MAYSIQFILVLLGLVVFPHGGCSHGFRVRRVHHGGPSSNYLMFACPPAPRPLGRHIHPSFAGTKLVNNSMQPGTATFSCTVLLSYAF